MHLIFHRLYKERCVLWLWPCRNQICFARPSGESSHLKQNTVWKQPNLSLCQFFFEFSHWSCTGIRKTMNNSQSQLECKWTQDCCLFDWFDWTELSSQIILVRWTGQFTYYSAITCTETRLWLTPWGYAAAWPGLAVLVTGGEVGCVVVAYKMGSRDMRNSRNLGFEHDLYLKTSRWVTKHVKRNKKFLKFRSSSKMQLYLPGH